MLQKYLFVNKIYFSRVKKNLWPLWPLFVDRVQLPQG